MNADERRLNQRGLEELTKQVLAAVFDVSNSLGAGFLEKVYHWALIRELRVRGMAALSEASFLVSYKGQCVGEYYADILVENELAVEIKCADRLTSEPMAQCINYLRASGKTLCLLVNFQRPTVEWKRVVLNYSESDMQYAHQSPSNGGSD